MKQVLRWFGTANKNTKKGEMMLETIISVAVFTILMVAVSGIITLSYKLISASEEQYARTEEMAVNVETKQNIGTPKSESLTFVFDDAAATTGSVDILLYDESSIVFFEAGT